MPNLIYDSVFNAQNYILNKNAGLSSTYIQDGAVRLTARFPHQVSLTTPTTPNYVNIWNPKTTTAFNEAVIESVDFVSDHYISDQLSGTDLVTIADLNGETLEYVFQRKGVVTTVTVNFAAVATAADVLTEIRAVLTALGMPEAGLTLADYCWLSEGKIPISNVGRLRLSSAVPQVVGPVDDSENYIYITSATTSKVLQFFGFYHGQYATAAVKSSELADGPGGYSDGLELFTKGDTNFVSVRNRPVLNLWQEVNAVRDLILHVARGILPASDVPASYGFVGKKYFQNDVQIADGAILKLEDSSTAKIYFNVGATGTKTTGSPELVSHTSVPPIFQYNFTFQLNPASQLANEWGIKFSGVNLAGATSEFDFRDRFVVKIPVVDAAGTGYVSPWNDQQYFSFYNNKLKITYPVWDFTSAIAIQDYPFEFVQVSRTSPGTFFEFAKISLSKATGFFTNSATRNTTASNAHGEGDGTQAIGTASHAEGTNTIASGTSSHAEGDGANATGNLSHAEGNSTVASGDSSHAEGDGANASGNFSHAEGDNTQASGIAAHAEGDGNASGDYSHVEGSGNLAVNDYSHAEGLSTTAESDATHAEGNSTTAGDGTALGGKAAHAEGDSTFATGAASHAEGGGTTASGDSSHAEGTGTTASGASSHAEGTGTIASGSVSHAEGAGSIASGTFSHAEGDTTASGTYSHSEGSSTTASGDFSHASGRDTNANGTNSYTGGLYSIASGVSSFSFGNSVVGSETEAIGVASFAFGKHVVAKEDYSFSFGQDIDITKLADTYTFLFGKTISLKTGTTFTDYSFAHGQNIELSDGEGHFVHGKYAYSWKQTTSDNPDYVYTHGVGDDETGEFQYERLVSKYENNSFPDDSFTPIAEYTLRAGQLIGFEIHVVVATIGAVTHQLVQKNYYYTVYRGVLARENDGAGNYYVKLYGASNEEVYDNMGSSTVWNLQIVAAATNDKAVLELYQNSGTTPIVKATINAKFTEVLDNDLSIR